FPFAIFVNRSMSINELKSTIETKIKINKKYGIKSLNIHAIGTDNIQKIKTALVDLKGLLSEEPEIDSGRNYIIVTIWF
ncbi:MAG: hypothetical protein NT162_00335, partial [Candidatus Woesebacteria bacterium]|nr:hypothetical protein [Candidatus Woesebacteria bacterium]